jgi:hypothetical protein
MGRIRNDADAVDIVDECPRPEAAGDGRISPEEVHRRLGQAARLLAVGAIRAAAGGSEPSARSSSEAPRTGPAPLIPGGNTE